MNTRRMNTDAGIGAALSVGAAVNLSTAVFILQECECTTYYICKYPILQTMDNCDASSHVKDRGKHWY
ncbi:hypothetical protein FKM82_006280 [Ascaphus truei]